MADVTWYDQQIPPEWPRKELIDYWKFSAGLASTLGIAGALAVVVMVFVFGRRADAGDVGIVIILPTFVVVLGILMRPAPCRDITRVGISASGVTLRFADGGSLDVPWRSMSETETYSQEDGYGPPEPWVFMYENERGRMATAFVFKDSGLVIQREVWRNGFRDAREPSLASEGPDFEDEEYAAPPWVQDGLTASYREGETRFGYRIAVRGPEVVLQSRTEWAGDLTPERKEKLDIVYDGPAAFEIWKEVEREWLDTPLRQWQEARYGDFFINLRRPPDAQWAGGGPARFVRRDTVDFRGTRLGALRFDAAIEEECTCAHVWRSGRSSVLLRMLSRRGSRFLPAGTCPECEGRSSKRRSCPGCRGTGKHKECNGTGVDRTEGRNWYEERTGILLRRETWRKGRLIGMRELKSLEPDVMARA